MIRALNNITKDNTVLPLFYVFTTEHLDKLSCKGNPAVVVIVDKLPTLKEHLSFFRLIQNDNRPQIPLPSDVTFAYISNSINNSSSEAISASEFSIRWFSSTSIIQRCGHGTLAAAAFVNHYIAKYQPTLSTDTHINFYSEKEELSVSIYRDEHSQESALQYALQLKYEALLPSNYGQYFTHKLVRENKTLDTDGYLIIELNCEREVREFTLTKTIIEVINKRALIITAISQNNNYDIVFRYFAPFYGELEDSATGSAGSLLMPFWQHLCANSNKQDASINNKASPLLRCYQASKNGGFFILKASNHQVHTVDIIGQVKESNI